jgi:hypothetical protein
MAETTPLNCTFFQWAVQGNWFPLKQQFRALLMIQLGKSGEQIDIGSLETGGMQE